MNVGSEFSPTLSQRTEIEDGDTFDVRVSIQQFQSSILSTMESLFAKQNEKLSHFTKEFTDLKSAIHLITQQYDDLNMKAVQADKRLAGLEDQVASWDLRVSRLESSINTLEQQARQCNVEIHNLPERRSENLFTILESVSNEIKYQVKKQDVVAVHRVPHADSKNSRPKNIIVKFGSRMMRDDFIAAARRAKELTTGHLKISGPPQKIYINEHLTLYNKILFRDARVAAAKCGFKFSWAKHGSIFVRRSDTSPVIAIRSSLDLSKIVLENQ